MAKNPKFDMLLDEMGQLHDLKNSDYASDGDPYSNFKFAACVAEGFTGVDAVFATMLGIKLARLRELKGKGKTPKNESVADSMRDLATYAALWASYDLPFSYDDGRLYSNGGEPEGRICPQDGGVCWGHCDAGACQALVDKINRAQPQGDGASEPFSSGPTGRDGA